MRPCPTRLALLVIAVLLALFTKDHANSWADGSRLGTIQGLVESRSLALDDTDFLWQGDKVWIGDEQFQEGHYYSHQPPMLAILGAVPYALLHYLGGLSIQDPWTYRLLTWLLVGLPVLAGLWALSRLLADAGCPPRWSAAWLLLAACGTALLPFSLVLNQHGPAFGLFALALYAATRARPATAGCLLGLACTIDLSAVFPALAVALPVLALTRFNGLARYVLGALPPLALHFGVNYSLVGDLAPLGLHTEAFRYPLSPFLLMALTGGEGGSEAAGTQALYAWRALFGQSGLFSLSPLLLLCVLCAPLCWRARAAERRLPTSALFAVLLAAVGVVTYYLVNSRNFGGSAYGMRWFAVFAPLCVLFPAALFGASPPRLLAPLVLALGLTSVGFSAVGGAEPWAKFAWLPHQRPMALLEEPGQGPASLSAHLRQEWARVRGVRETFARRDYVLWYEDLLHRHGRVRTRLALDMPPAQAEAWLREGVERLEPIVDLLDRVSSSASSRPVGHYWLGRFHERLGQLPEAERALSRCLDIVPGYPPAVKSMGQVRESRRQARD